MGLADIQDLLGHADISTTKKMYTHIELEPLRKAMDKFTEYMEIDS
jgi:site-specific recombinase XerD